MESEQPIIRRAVPGDEQGIHENHMRSICEVCIKDHGAEEIKGWGHRPLGDRWVEAIKNDDVWVLEQGKTICGHAYIRFEQRLGKEIGFIKGLYLAPELVGKGWGRKLADLMLDTAKKRGVKKVALYSTITAHQFYESLGFRDSEPKKQVEVAGYPVTCFPMEMKI